MHSSSSSMALLPPTSLGTLFHISSQHYLLNNSFHNPITLTPSSFNPPTHNYSKQHRDHRSFNSKLLAISYRYFIEEEDDDDDNKGENQNFDEAVALFNGGEYYKCHDYLEALWLNAEEPTRTLIHGILQCAVGFHHLFNQVFIHLGIITIYSIEIIANFLILYIIFCIFTHIKKIPSLFLHMNHT